MRRLAVYEPPYTGGYDPGPAFGRHLDELVAAGRRDAAAEQWLAATGTTPASIESIKSSPGWAHRQALLLARVRVQGLVERVVLPDAGDVEIPGRDAELDEPVSLENTPGGNVV
jgi:hypothetical protein